MGQRFCRILQTDIAHNLKDSRSYVFLQVTTHSLCHYISQFMVCIPCTWWGYSEITLFSAFINNDTCIVSQTCCLHSNFWRSLGIAVRWPSCTTRRNREEVKNTQTSSSRTIFREDDSKISVTFMWENSHSLIIGTPITVRCPLGRALTSASVGSHYPLLSSFIRCLSQRLCHWHWSGGIIPTAVPQFTNGIAMGLTLHSAVLPWGFSSWTNLFLLSSSCLSGIIWQPELP